MEYILSGIIGYILGSIPTGFLVLKKMKNIDVTKNGTGNVGTMYSYRVTDSKMIGVIVLIIDLLKGLLSVLFSKMLFGDYFIYPMTALIFAVLGHCYSPWLKFKGGRGLATAAGGSLVLSIPVLVIWIFFYLVGYLFRKNVHFASAASTLLTGAVCFSTGHIIYAWTSPPAYLPIVFEISTAIMLFIILTRHIAPIIEYYKNPKNHIRKNRS